MYLRKSVSTSEHPVTIESFHDLFIDSIPAWFLHDPVFIQKQFDQQQ